MGDTVDNASNNATPSISSLNPGTPPAPQPTQASDLSAQLQPPAQAPQGNAVLQLAPSQPATPSPAAVTKNPRLMHLVGSVLSGLAGPPPSQYTTDETGKMTRVAPAPETAGTKARRIAQAALTGLAAGSQVGPQKSALAAGLAGAGAGAETVMQKQKAQDLQARAQSKEEFEREQNAKLHTMEIMRGNSMVYQTMKHLHQEDLDKDETYKVNSDIANAAEAENIKVQRMNGDQLLAQFHENPQQLLQEGKILPVGEKEVTDPKTGDPVIDATTGGPKWERQYAVVDALHRGAGDSKNIAITMPVSFAEALKKYGPYSTQYGVQSAGEFDKLVKGAQNGSVELDASQLVRLHNILLDGHQQALKGEAAAVAMANPDATDKKNPFVKWNPVTKEFLRDASGNLVPVSAKESADIAEKQQQAKTGKATEIKDIAEAGRAEAEAKKARKETADVIPANVSDLHGEAYLQTLSSGESATIRAIGEGRQTLSPRQLATEQGRSLAEKLHQAYPDFDETKAKTWQKANNEYRGSGKTATQIVPAYNTALEHMQALYDNTTAEGIFQPVSKAYQDRETELGYVTREVGKAVSAGALTQKESEDLLSKLSGGLTPANKRERISETARLLHDKIDEYQTKFNESAPSSAIKVPLLISPKAAGSYDYVASGGKVKQQAQQPRGGRPQGIPVQDPQGGMHYFPDQASADKFKTLAGIK